MVDSIHIKNGTVIDPANGEHRKRDVFIQNGVFVDALEEKGGETRVIDAEGCFVTPGLIDSHMHMYQSRNQIGGYADIACPPGCVTTCIDAGSAGIANFHGFYRDSLHSATGIKAAVNASLYGIEEPPYEEIQDPVYATPEAMRPLFEKYPDALVGIKLRVHERVTKEFGLRALEQAEETASVLRAEGHRCRIMIHFGNLAQGISLEDVLNLMQPGDVITHTMRPPNGTTAAGSSILGEDGKIQPCVWKARARGVIFDTSCGRAHLSLNTIRQAVSEQFFPQIISTDVVGWSVFLNPTGWLILKMATYLNAGMPLDAVVEAVTATPARLYGFFDQAGSLTPGKPADVAVFRMEDRPFTLRDPYGGSMDMTRLLVPMATVKNGAVVFQQIYLGL